MIWKKAERNLRVEEDEQGEIYPAKKLVKITAVVYAEVPHQAKFEYSADGFPVGLYIGRRCWKPLVALENEKGTIISTDAKLRKQGIVMVEYDDATGVEEAE